MKVPNFAAMNPSVAQAIEKMMAEQGDTFSLEKLNLAELERRTGITRAKLRRMKEHDFEEVLHASKGRRAASTLLNGYTIILDDLLRSGVTNSAVCLDRLRKSGFTGGKAIAKESTTSRRHLARYAVAPQGNRGRRCSASPGEAEQMGRSFLGSLFRHDFPPLRTAVRGVLPQKRETGKPVCQNG